MATRALALAELRCTHAFHNPPVYTGTRRTPAAPAPAALPPARVLSQQGPRADPRARARPKHGAAQSLLKAMTSMDWMFSDSPSRTSSSSMIASIDSTLASSITAVICIFLMPYPIGTSLAAARCAATL